MVQNNQMSGYSYQTIPVGLSNTPGMNQSYLSSIQSYSIIGGREIKCNIASGAMSVVLGGKDVKIKGNSTAVISATGREFESEESGTMYLRADKGVMIETDEPGEFVNASEELGKIEDIMDELREIKEMLREIYWAPNGPGYLKAQSSFQSQSTKE